MANCLTKTTLLFLIILNAINAETDLKIGQIITLGNKLLISECKRLVPSLRFDSYEFPDAAITESMKLPHDKPCVDLLAEWFSNGATSHTLLARRLKQIGRQDLSTWLSKTTFDGGNDNVEETYVTEIFTIEAEPDVIGTEPLPDVVTEANVNKLDTDDADLFAEFMAAIVFITGIIYLCSKLFKKCKKQDTEEVPLRSFK